jgi:hypothetical protein
MIYHIVVGDHAAAQLEMALHTDPAVPDTIVTMRDILNVGPLAKREGQKFSELRGEFWQQVVITEKGPAEVDDLERLLRTANELSKNEGDKIWLWVAPLPADVCAYYWTMRYLSKYAGRIYIINIAGLPFLDEQGKIFFPKSLAEILPKELIKAKKLARPVTKSEFEIDAEEWLKISEVNAGIRVLEGGKKLLSKNNTHYDQQLMTFFFFFFQKAQKVIAQAMAKFNIPTGDLYLAWRLREMGELGKLKIQGDTTKSSRDFEVCLPVTTSEAVSLF